MREFLAGTRAFLLAVAVHLLMAALVVLGTMNWQPFKPPAITGMTIEAVIVDTGALRERREQIEKEAERAEARKAAQEKRIKDLAEQQVREKELKERQAQEAKEKLAAEEAAEQKRIKEQAENKREEDMRLQKMREKQEADRLAKEKRLQDEMEKLREQREKAARESKLQEEKLKQLEARKQIEADRQRQQIEAAEMQRQMEAEARAGALGTLSDQYQAEIRAQVTSNWLRPPTARAGLSCKLKIVQIPGGEVISAAISGACNADEATRRSLVAAVERAGNLPYRGYEDVFQREIDFIFTYDGD
jgi:colicin import membrane protein